jgi:hypothetical protein
LVPYLGIGYELLYSREIFRYSLEERRTEQKPEGLFDSGILLVGGIDHRLGPRLRLEGFLSFVSIDPKVSAASGEYPSRGEGGLDAGVLGLRMLWRLP